jgi:hypothetical protein
MIFWDGGPKLFEYSSYENTDTMHQKSTSLKHGAFQKVKRSSGLNNSKRDQI